MAKLRWLGNALVFVPSDGSEPDFPEAKQVPERVLNERQDGTRIPRAIQIVKVEGIDKSALSN